MYLLLDKYSNIWVLIRDSTSTTDSVCGPTLFSKLCVQFRNDIGQEIKQHTVTFTVNAIFI